MIPKPTDTQWTEEQQAAAQILGLTDSDVPSGDDSPRHAGTFAVDGAGEATGTGPADWAQTDLPVTDDLATAMSPTDTDQANNQADDTQEKAADLQQAHEVLEQIAGATPIETLADSHAMDQQVDANADQLAQALTAEQLTALGNELLADSHADERFRQMEQAKEADRIRRIASYDLPDDYTSVYADTPVEPRDACDNIPDGLTRCIVQKGVVDMEYIAHITGKPLATVVKELKQRQLVYQDPQLWQEQWHRGWVTADEYLSGNVLAKLNTAKDATEKYLGLFDNNVQALQQLIPAPLCGNDIYFTLGSPWIPDRIVEGFVRHVLNIRYKLPKGVYHDRMLGRWSVRYKEPFTRYSTKRIAATEIIERTLNNTPVRIYDSFAASNRFTRANKIERRINKAETELALEKQRMLIEAFDKYVRGDQAIMQELTDVYYRRYGCLRARQYNGSFLTLPGKNPYITLYPHQYNAVARIVWSHATLLAHGVGTGKTYIMIAACMEMRRMGISDRNLFVVPNSILAQWQDAFATLYPDSRVLTVYPKDFTPSKRQDMLRRIRDEDYDAVIMAYSSFRMIPVGAGRRLAEWRHRLADLPDEPGYRAARSECITRIAAEQLAVQQEDKSSIKFEQLRFQSLFVDEAHNFKNITIPKSADYRGAGDAGGSSMCDDMHLKVRVMNRYRKHKSIVFATGTPITNSITDMYAMQTFLQPGELRFLGLQNFDEWAMMFGEKAEEFEIDIDATNYRLNTRFNRFHNLPELTNIFAMVADFHLVDHDPELYRPATSDTVQAYRGANWTQTSFDGSVTYHNIEVKRNALQKRYIASLADRADSIRDHNGALGDNLLKVTTDGRKAALDYRLIDPAAPAQPHSKVEAAADIIADIYRNRPTCTQLVFCDLSTPKAGFNLYDELARLLVLRGIRVEDIAFVHSFPAERDRRRLFEMINNGAIRILIGSTFKLGTGVNVQRHLYAIHHLDVPWRPADMIQREGRMLRQGNLNDSVEIYRYVTEGSFDAYSWQLLESKQRFISQLLYNSLDRRDGEDVDSLTLDYAQVKALAVGDPRIKTRIETANRLVRCVLLQRAKNERREQLHSKLLNLPLDIQHLQQLKNCCRKDHATFGRHKDEPAPRRALGEAVLAAYAMDIERPMEEGIAIYRGFQIVIPPHPVYTHPVLVVRGSHDWRVDIDTFSPIGVATKVDNVIENFTDRAQKLAVRIRELETEMQAAQAELEQEDNLDDEINSLREQLSLLDRLLGVNKDD